MPFISRQSLEKLQQLAYKNEDTIEHYKERLWAKEKALNEANNDIEKYWKEIQETKDRLQKVILLAGLNNLEVVDVPEKVIPEKRIPATIVMRKVR